MDYDYEKMEQLIASNKRILMYLKLMFIEEIYEDSFQEEFTVYCCQHRVNENKGLAHFFAIWIPGDKDSEQIMKRIKEIASEG